MANDLVKTQDAQLMVNDPWQKADVVKKIFAPKLTNDEFMIFYGMGKSLGANPFTREIWAVKYNENQPPQIFCGRDFYRRTAQEQQNYDGHIVNAVYESDGFTIKNGQPEHIVNSFKDRGNLVGAFCAVYKKGEKVPFFVTVRLDEYDKKQSNWKTMPETMIKKVAEAQALRGAYQGIFKGTYDESEQFDPKAINAESEELKLKKIELSKLADNCQDDELKAQMIDDITTAEANGTLTIETLEKWIIKFK